MNLQEGDTFVRLFTPASPVLSLFTILALLFITTASEKGVSPANNN